MFVATGDGMQLISDSYSELDYTPNVGPAFQPITVQNINPQTGQPIGTARAFDSHAKSGQLAGLIEVRDGTLTCAAVFPDPALPLS